MAITVKELREFINKIPEEFDEFTLVNGDYALIETEGKDEKFYYRLDKPILLMTVDKETKELAFLHQTQESIDDIINDDYE